eukprot:s455_g6.t1
MSDILPASSTSCLPTPPHTPKERWKLLKSHLSSLQDLQMSALVMLDLRKEVPLGYFPEDTEELEKGRYHPSAATKLLELQVELAKCRSEEADRDSYSAQLQQLARQALESREQGSTTGGPEQSSALSDVSGKVTEAMEKVLELMQMNAEPQVIGARPSSYRYARIAHLALLLCQSELARELPCEEAQRRVTQGTPSRAGAWTTHRATQHQLITNAIGHLADMLGTTSAPNVEEDRLPEELKPAAKVAKALLVQIQVGRIWVHLHRALELANTTPGLENVASDVAEVEGRVQAATCEKAMADANAIKAHVQNHYLVHITGATIGSNYHEELKRLAWHATFHEAKALRVPPINTKFTLENGTATMERQTRPTPLPPVVTTEGVSAAKISSLGGRHSNSLEAVSKHMLGQIKDQLQAASQAASKISEASALNKELVEANSLTQAALSAHPLLFGLHDDYQDLDLAI